MYGNFVHATNDASHYTKPLTIYTSGTQYTYAYLRLPVYMLLQYAANNLEYVVLGPDIWSVMNDGPY